MRVDEVELIKVKDTIVFYCRIGEYNQRLVTKNKQLLKWNCTCKWGSIGRFQKDYYDKKCKHIKLCIETLQKWNYLK